MWIGVYLAAPPTLENNERRPALLDAQGRIIVVGTGGGGASVVVGDNTVDLTHAAPTDAVDTRSHLYAYSIENTNTLGPPVALAALRIPFFAVWDGAGASPPNPPAPLWTSSILLGINGDAAPGATVQFLNPAVGVTRADLNNLYTLSGDSANALVTQSTMVAVTGTAMRRLALDASNNALRVNPRAVDYAGLDVRVLANGVGKQITLPGVPAPTDTLDAATPFYQAATGGGPTAVIKAGPGYLLSLQLSLVPAVV
jgi:hypothetical protein